MLTSTDTKPKTTLTSLPVELMVIVAEHFEAQDLLALRSSCRALEDTTHKIFADAFFSKRTHSYSERGLQSLVGITNIPSLAKGIKEVRIAVEDRPAPKGTTHLTIMSVWKREQQLADQLELTLSPLLAQVLRNLGATGTLPDFTVVVHHPDTGYYGLDTTRKLSEHGTDAPYTTEALYNNAVRGTLTSMVEIKFPCRALDLCVGSRNTAPWHGRSAFDIGSDYLLAMLKQPALSPFAGLTTLKLRFKRLDSLWSRWSGPGSDGPVKLLSLMPAMKHLALEGSGWYVGETGWGDYGLADFISIISAPHLETLELYGINVSKAAFIKSLAHFKGSLKQLTLKECILPFDDVPEYWTPVFEFIMAEMALERVTIQKLYGCGNEDPNVNHVADDFVLGSEGKIVDCVLKGAAEVEGRLTELANAAQYLPCYGRL
ncbi:hypothetical protein LTR08_006128 [Meristemomyces frigidus]|nr:hypothetical protein LTR08_006128 [Meristemomyces frigidus]